MAGEVSLAGKYPFRETYTFVGWSLTANGDVVSSVNVSEDTTLYAIWKKATAWTFDRDGYQEGFTVENGFNVEVKDGIFKALETGYSETNILKIKSPKLDINSSDYAQLKIKMQNTVFDENTKLGVTIHTTNGFAICRCVCTVLVPAPPAAVFKFDNSLSIFFRCCVTFGCKCLCAFPTILNSCCLVR